MKRMNPVTPVKRAALGPDRRRPRPDRPAGPVRRRAKPAADGSTATLRIGYQLIPNGT
ncbi:hypothetical protein [Streptosporangium vulgare]|uniref:hypothetical protein n=1 Tax=Streptosporangium vulgare TaxID=46190 RepID=UPI0031D3ADAD